MIPKEWVSHRMEQAGGISINILPGSADLCWHAAEAPAAPDQSLFQRQEEIPEQEAGSCS